MADVSREEVERIAALARLALTDAEAERAVTELEAILGYVALLESVDTEGVEPTRHVLPLATPMRDDAGAAAMDPELAVANAPDREGTAFVVPKVIEGEEEG
ncbi:MAG: Asp-tRNA(Asn)/Glu-tRNA(Gln) amidotransferase subunit GatC [Myxococcota bacterium]|jgi:aspartyl-tRNA(Asn)/glutamyl-tRNA(Gln) amidotransferase subunit C|nr:Asp-tRNA(Asn)/Glu-tRNA(Gln) amidotransferase GatCAB subunit C [Deltaproteobacteria bacterium]MCP4239716.1 Asp-tRNA(Asn)/Glu-tRNA(Gln) amidotransferase subunit GatC [bacterium]MDP6074435.1 Asp-tRNA(Asn)/Glu-tRNA(Gln) amidotransferase subunit GatC [Myxococcota bacterium]MDP6244154.1 Asp-tRNA(Asn)/Glu-tRNA(Gln) amidotransferase subunit GatC [Myxococcota bacterium]MDP7073820.1 Asp-tRNA(Asn)/Glu-tRNA(Gln) amidotransferase subunit GatC [Myxococcota bacterium]